MGEPVHRSVEKFQNRLREQGHMHEVVQLPDSTRTAKEAAQAIGCDVDQIAKSIIFRLVNAGEPVLIIASGKNRIDEKRIEQLVEDKLGKADANFVKRTTGYVIGGVPPLAHDQAVKTFIDEDLFQFAEIWAAAGHPKAVFKLAPDELQKMTEAEVVQVS